MNLNNLLNGLNLSDEGIKNFTNNKDLRVNFIKDSKDKFSDEGVNVILFRKTREEKEGVTYPDTFTTALQDDILHRAVPYNGFHQPVMEKLIEKSGMQHKLLTNDSMNLGLAVVYSSGKAKKEGKENDPVVPPLTDEDKKKTKN